jgi:hypothetical protein
MRRLKHDAALAVVAACLFFSGSFGTADAKPTCSGIAWHTLRDGTQYCPQSHGVLADVNWIRLSWSSWGGAVAVGRGYSAHDIFPDGRLSQYLRPIRLRLFSPRRCSAQLRIYSEITVTAYSHTGGTVVSHSTSSIPCNGETGGGNG